MNRLPAIAKVLAAYRSTEAHITVEDIEAAWREHAEAETTRGPWPVTVKHLSSGYYHVRGYGPENWAQPPEWPCDEETLREHAASGASEEFIREALAAMPVGETDRG